MRNFYTAVYRCSLHILSQSALKSRLNNTLLFQTTLSLLISICTTSSIKAQKLEFSYSYINLSRNSGGGTLEQGDTIEVHALVKVNSTTNNFYYIDTIR